MKPVCKHKLREALDVNFPEPETDPFARLYFTEGERSAVLWEYYESERGFLICHWVDFNQPPVKLSDVQAKVLTELPLAQPETENDKLICTELIDMGLAVKTEAGIKPVQQSRTKPSAVCSNPLQISFSRTLLAEWSLPKASHWSIRSSAWRKA